MAPAIVSRFEKLITEGVFKTGSFDASFNDFQSYNLIYGLNGSSKTTISRVFKALDAADESIPVQNFELLLSDGTKISENSNTDLLQNRILVFNEDFISENLRWSDSYATPVFYISKDAARKSDLLDRVNKRIEYRENERKNAAEKLNNANSNLSKLQKNVAKTIAEAASFGRHYNANSLKKDVHSEKIESFRILSDEEKDARKRIIAQQKPYEKFKIPDFNFLDVGNTLEKARKICKTSLSKISLSEIEDNPTMIPWIRQGVNYHEKERLRQCLFCGNSISDERFGALKDIVEKGLEKLISDAENSKTQLDNLLESVEAFYSRLPDRQLITPTAMSDGTELFDRIQNDRTVISQMIRFTRAVVLQKCQNPLLDEFPELDREHEKCDENINIAEKNIQNLSDIIRQHNEEQDAFEERQRTAAEEIKHSILLENRDSLIDAENECQRAEKNRDIWNSLIQKASSLALRLKQDIEAQGPAVQTINEFLRGYLGHQEIFLESYGEGYRIRRRGQVISGTLSEGERTALALCYFIAKFGESGREKSNQIIVVDDPVSSLDSGSLNYAFNLLRRNIEGAAQIFILTHNIVLLNECKKWLRKEEQEKGTAAWFLLQPLIGNDGYRVSKLRNLPKLLKGHDSEYGYLFFLAKTTADEGVESEFVPGYIMPNNLRRLLELYLAFKIPGSESVLDKIRSTPIADSGVDTVKLQAIERLAQVESHSSAMEDFAELSAMSIEETGPAAEAVLDLIRTLDPEHYEGMLRMCRKRQF